LYARLVEGGRLRERRRVSWPEHKVRKGEKAATVPAGYPAQRDLWQRIERARLLELEEGVRQSGLWCTCRDTMPHEKRLKGL
jgi:hypothetical protein